MRKHRPRRYGPSIINFFMTAILIIAQFVWLSSVVAWGARANSGINIGLQVIALILALYICSRDIRSSHKISWTFLILFLPIVGIVTYFLFGRPELTSGKRKKMSAVLEDSKPYRIGEEAIRKDLAVECPDAYLQSEYIANFAGYPLHTEVDTRYYDSGEAMFPEYLSDLKKAKHFVFIEFFILGTGEMLGKTLDILEEKVKEGVEVFIIFDDFGSIQVLPRKFDVTLEAMGIHAIRFNPFRPFLSIVMNNRDHRKIVVVDNQVCYTGGVNLSDEYINAISRFGYWKDAAVRITGPATSNFSVMFMEMWEYARGEKLDYAKFLRPFENNPYYERTDIQSYKPEKGVGYVQPYCDFPLDREYVGENVYLNLIGRAHHYVYIATPYLIISSEVSKALINAAKCGVDVRILVPAIPDKKLVYTLTKSNFRSLVNGGVKIYTYTPGFVHTKCFVADDSIATIGSINLDYRSLTLHFECGSFHYNTKAVMDVKKDLLSAIDESHMVSVEECENKNVVDRTILMVLKLFAPML
ncbi:MAG: cardiolipin synthase [Lachnospiraceae bacterium]|nr:cardiolipin synthase [Lachnospiraceae bacterium]